MDIKGFHNMTPLHVAAAFGHDRAVKILLEAGHAPNVVDKNRFSPLHIAAHLGHMRGRDLCFLLSLKTPSSIFSFFLFLYLFSDHFFFIYYFALVFRLSRS